MKTIGSMQNPWDSVPISSGTLTTELGLTTIWTPWSNESDANLECCYSSQLTIVRVIKKNELISVMRNQKNELILVLTYQLHNAMVLKPL